MAHPAESYDDIRKEWDAQNEQLKKEGKWDAFMEFVDKEQRSQLAHYEAFEEAVRSFPV